MEEKLSGLHWSLGILQLFIALNGIAGGLGLIAEPTGSNLGWTTAILSQSPFVTYLWPGIFLFSIIGIGTLFAGLATLMKMRLAAEFAAALGLILVGWIVLQIVWLGYLFWLQPLFLGLGVLEAILAIILWRNLFERQNVVV